MLATGKFEVNLSPTQFPDPFLSDGLQRLKMRKQWTGDVVGNSVGEMFGLRDQNLKQGGYVAFEKVTGSISGKKGSFVLQHFGTMTNEKDHSQIAIVPGSGTDELASIAGDLTIMIEDGMHKYRLAYTLDSA